jgi:hypothetical protein
MSIRTYGFLPILFVGASLSGCMAIPAAIGGATAVNATSESKAQDTVYAPQTNPDEARRALSGTHVVVMSAGGTELHVAEALERSGYTVAQDQSANIAKLTTGARLQAMKAACEKHRADAATAVRLIEIKAANGAGMFIGRLTAKMDIAIDVLNCKTGNNSAQTGTQEIAMTFGQKIDEWKQAGTVGAAQLITYRSK